MMMAHLLNFGANDRVVNDSSNNGFKIPVGALVTHDVHEVHYRMIKQAMANETLMIIPSECKLSDKMQGIMDLLPQCNDAELDDLTSNFNKIMGHHPDGLRPTRDMIRIALREGARKEIKSTLMAMAIEINAARVTIREEGDAVTRQPVKLPSAESLRPSNNTPPPKDQPAPNTGGDRPKRTIQRERL